MMKTIIEDITNLYQPTPAGARFEVGADFPAFNGHFPGEPVLPAIVQIQMAVHAINMRFNTAKKLKEIKKAKFAAPIFTGAVIDIAVNQKNDFFEASVTTGGKICSSFTISLE